MWLHSQLRPCEGDAWNPGLLTSGAELTVRRDAGVPTGIYFQLSSGPLARACSLSAPLQGRHPELTPRVGIKAAAAAMHVLPWAVGS